MVGNIKTSTLDAITSYPLSPYLKLKTVTALVVTPRQSGHRKVSMLVIVMQFFLTCLAPFSSLNCNQEVRFTAQVTVELALVSTSFVHLMSLLTGKESAIHLQTTLVTVSQLKVARTCSPTCRPITSQITELEVWEVIEIEQLLQ
jgi:hypothetical protein